MSSFPHIFSPLSIAGITLPNRIMMGSMHTGLEDYEDFSRLTAYFVERANHGCSLMVTGAFSPNLAGRLSPDAAVFKDKGQISKHRKLTDAVHAAGSYILLQLIHSGRYGYHSGIVAPSPIPSSINKQIPREMDDEEIIETIEDFVTAANLAENAGYDGVEIMGSEGYLLSQFLTPRTNHRDDGWGRDYSGRVRLPREIVLRTREAVKPGFIIMFRLSVIDLVQNGLSGQDVIKISKTIESAGADILNSGVGWHESPVPTIAQAVPRAAFVADTAKIKPHVGIPVIASNRINTPEVAEKILKAGHADMISMARPFLADPAFLEKARRNRSDQINTCIACNQACLDRYFVGQISSCIVNPRACHETETKIVPAGIGGRVAVIGAGVAGLAAAKTSAERGYSVTIFEAGSEIGGQFNLAKKIPGKSEFFESLRYFQTYINELNIDLRLSITATLEEIDRGQFDAVIIASGVQARRPAIEGIGQAHVVGYTEVINGEVDVGTRVSIIGGGGIAFDVALFLLEANDLSFVEPSAFRERWGIGQVPPDIEPRHQITMFQRSEGPMGRNLGKSTGWIHRAILKRNQVRQISGVSYNCIDRFGLHITREGSHEFVRADTIIICAGQESKNELVSDLKGEKIDLHLVGGARSSIELNAERAIKEGIAAAARL